MSLTTTETAREEIAMLNKMIGELSTDMKALQLRDGGVCVLDPSHEAYKLSQTRFNLLRKRNDLQRKIGR